MKSPPPTHAYIECLPPTHVYIEILHYRKVYKIFHIATNTKKRNINKQNNGYFLLIQAQDVFII